MAVDAHPHNSDKVPDVRDVSPFAIGCEKLVVDESCGIVHFVHPENRNVYAMYIDNASGLSCIWCLKPETEDGGTNILAAHKATEEEARQWHEVLDVLTTDFDVPTTDTGERVLQ
ncbi:MAG: hypothetical protein HY455_02490 [Parcubacteria group bacterium]|nr:hypothetical protein [Parcubacteria group bacterium]